MVGPGHSHKLIKYLDINTGEEKMMTLGAVMDNIMPDMMQRMMTNPFITIFPWLADKEILAVDKRFCHNCYSLRAFISDIVKEKKKNADPEAGDVVSLIL